MAQLNLRSIPDELMRKLKARAAENGVTLKGECLAMIRKYCGVIDGQSRVDSVGAEGSAGQAGSKGSHAGRGGSASVASVEAGGTGDSAPVPVLRNDKGAAQRLRTVQPVRGELAGRGTAGPRPKGLQACPVDESHRVLPNGERWFCVPCGKHTDELT